MSQLPNEGPVKTQIYREDLNVPAAGPVTVKPDAALSLVVRDAERAEAWLSEKQWTLHWKEADMLYQAPRSLSTWEGTTVAKANVQRFKVASHVNSILPKLMDGLFRSDPPFTMRPRPGTTQDTVREKQAVFSAVLDEIEFEEEADDFLFNETLFGTGIAKYGWLSTTKKQKRYVRSKSEPEVDLPMRGKVKVPTTEADEFKVKEYDEQIERPFFKSLHPMYVLVSPDTRRNDIRTARYVIHKDYLTFDDLDALRDQEGYDIPSREKLLELFLPPEEQPVGAGPLEQQMPAWIHHAAPRDEAQSIDPTQQPLEVLEWWSGNRVITVLNRALKIRDQENDVGDGKVPFLSSTYWKIPDAMYGLGVGALVGQDQRVSQGVMNSALNILSLALNPQYKRKRGSNVPTQQIRQRLGGIIDMDDTEDLQLLEVPKVPPEAWTALQVSSSESEAASGANELLVQGGLPTAGRTSMGRTATGAGNMQAASDSRLAATMDAFARKVFVPFIIRMDDLINERMPLTALRAIIGEELGDDWSFDPSSYLNARLKYDVLAGSRMSAKKAMAQSLPMMIQLMENQALIQQLASIGYTIDVKELFEMIFEVSEWKDVRQVVRKLTDQEMQTMQAQNPAAQKVQGQAQLNNQKFQQQQQLLDQENMARAGRDVLRQVFEKNVEGAPAPDVEA